MRKYILSISLLAMALLSFIACNVDAEGKLYAISDKQELTFPSTMMISEVVSEDNGVVRIPIYRGANKGEFTATIEMMGANEEIFELKSSSIKFNGGENISYIEISFGDIDNLGPTATYEFKIGIMDEEELSPSAIDEIKVRVSRKLTWKSWGDGEFTSNDLYGDTYPVEVQSAEEDPNLYKAIGLYKDGYDILISVNKAEGTAKITQQEIGLSIFGATYPKTWIRADACTYENGVITITPGDANNYNRWIVEPAPGTLGAFISDYEILVLPKGSY